MFRRSALAPLVALAVAVPVTAQTSPVDPAAPAACQLRPRSFGCANAANLAVMAAPADLLRGRALGPSDGVIEAAAVGRLYSDKVKDLRREGATDQGGGSPK